MNRQTLLSIVCAIGLLGYAIFFFSGLSAVPFHPDEATQIFTSADIDTLLSDPSSLFYKEPAVDADRQHYRLIDAPLTRTNIGIFRRLTGTAGLAADWNWSLSWDQNEANGALPSDHLLFIARLACAWPVPFAIALFYLLLKKYLHPLVCLGLSLVLGCNPLVLLHTRRAMAEGWMFSLAVVLIWIVFSKPRGWVWWYALAVCGISLQSKQITAPLIAAAGLALVWEAWRTGQWKAAGKTILGLAGAAVLGFYVLNPILWADPLRVLPRMLNDRLAFSQAQSVEYAREGSGLALTSASMRFAGILAQSAFAPPAYSDVGNYNTELEPAVKEYERNPIHTLLGGWIWGAALLIAVLTGMVFSILRAIRRKADSTVGWLWVLSLLLIGFFTAFISIGFQRYYLLFLPVWMMWIGTIFKQSVSQDKPIKKDNLEITQ